MQAYLDGTHVSQDIHRTIRDGAAPPAVHAWWTPQDTKSRQLKTLPRLGHVASIRVDLHGDLGADSPHPIWHEYGGRIVSQTVGEPRHKNELAHAAAAKRLANSGGSVWPMRRAAPCGAATCGAR